MSAFRRVPVCKRAVAIQSKSDIQLEHDSPAAVLWRNPRRVGILAGSR
jgi:hypothetical protein